MEKVNRINFLLTGRYALFSDPVTRVGGEKCTYPIPTFEALRGVCDSIYWKPTIVWQVERFRVMNRIQTQFKGARPLAYTGGSGGLSGYTYLKEVEYQVEARFVWNLDRPDLEGDRNEDKHYYMALRALKRGGRRDIFLGARECQGYAEPCAFGVGRGYYDSAQGMDFGTMFHSFEYAAAGGEGSLRARYWNARMGAEGVVKSGPEDQMQVRDVKRYALRFWTLGVDMRRVEEEAGAD